MKYFFEISTAVTLALMLLVITNCREVNVTSQSENIDPTDAPFISDNRTILSGYLIPADTSLTNLEGISVYLLKNVDDWNRENNRQYAIYTTNSFNDGYYFFKGIENGSYIISAWLDADNNNRHSSGDITGTYGAGRFPNVDPEYINVIDGDTLHININIFTIP